MNFLSKYSPLYAPDGVDGAAIDAVVDPVAVVVDPAAVVDPVADPEPQPAPKPRVPDPLINTITGLRADKRGLESEVDRQKRRADEAEALAARLARGDKADPAQPAPRVAQAPTEEAEIDRRAEYKVFVRDVEGMKERGIKQFGPQFNDTIRALSAVGADNDAFVAQVMAVDPDHAHALLNNIAQDLERAVSLVGMDPTRRIAELTRMAMAASAAAKTDPKIDPTPAPAVKVVPGKTVSKAPAPAPALDPSASKVVDWRSDDASDEEFDRGFKETMAKRSARR